MIPTSLITEFLYIILNFVWAYIWGSQSDYDYWYNRLVDWWKDVLSRIKKWSDDVYNTLAPYVNRLKKWIDRAEWLVTAAWNNLVWLLYDVWENLGYVLVDWYDKLKRLATTIFYTLDNLATNLYYALYRLATSLYYTLESLATSLYNTLSRLATTLYHALDWLATAALTYIEWLVSIAWNFVVYLTMTMYNFLLWLFQAARSNLEWLVTIAMTKLTYWVDVAATVISEFLADPLGFVLTTLRHSFLGWMGLWEQSKLAIADFVQKYMPDEMNFWEKHRSAIWSFFEDPAGFILGIIRDVFIDWVCDLVAERW